MLNLLNNPKRSNTAVKEKQDNCLVQQRFSHQVALEGFDALFAQLSLSQQA